MLQQRSPDALSDAEHKIYRALRIAASYGAPCPTNAELAERLGYAAHRPGSKPGTVAEVVKALEVAGLIRVYRFATSRIVEIVQTGKRTSQSTAQNRAHWRWQLLGTATYADLVGT